MSKLFCGECMCIVDEPYHWTEPHGEPMSGCECGNGLIEIKPCHICGEYPGDEYNEGELPNGGICLECLDIGIQYLDEYIQILTPEERQGYVDSDDFAKWLINKSRKDKI